MLLTKIYLYSGLVKSINNSILVVLGLILLVAVHGGESLRPFGVNINVRDVRGQRPPFIMPRFDVLGLRRLRDLKQSNQVGEITNIPTKYLLWVLFTGASL